MLDRTIIPSALPLNKVHFPAIESSKLTNGIPVHNCRFGGQEVVDLSLIFPAGRSFEKQTSVASFTAKLIQEGTRRMSALEFARQLDFFGATIQVESGLETAVVNLSCLTKHLESTLPLLREMLLEPLFAASELENLRQRTIQHLEVEAKKTEFQARKHFNRLLFGATHPYGRHSEKEDIAAIQIPELQAFHKRFFNLTNAEIVISGKYDSLAVMKLLEQNLGAPADLDAGMKVTEAESTGLAFEAAPDRLLHYVEMPDSMQATIRAGHRAFDRKNNDHNGMQVVNTILGGYFGSRLMRNIREEKGYTYGIGSGWIPMKYSGLFVVQTDIGNEYIQPTLDEIDKEIEIFMRDGVEKDELSLVKNYMLGRSVSARETPGQIASSLRNMIIYGLPFSTLEEKFDQIQAVTVDDVHRLANQYLQPSKLLQVVSGKMS